MDWITDEFVFQDVSNNYISISTPFIDSIDDNIEILAKLDNVLLTDLGETIFNLESQGFFLIEKNLIITNFYIERRLWCAD